MRAFLKIHSKSILFLSFIIGLSLIVKSLHYPQVMNFSTDQGFFSLQAFNLWQNKEFTLVGPTASFNYNGRFLIQSSAIFYGLLMFLIPAQFDPLLVSWLFTLFGCLMCIPVFIGMKKLNGEPAAFIATTCFALFPFYAEYSRFLWNPNLQFVCSSFLILSLGFLHQRKKPWSFAITGFFASFLLLFHYQMILGIAILTLFLWSFEKMRGKFVLFFFFGLLIGYAPMIVFELTSNFYNLRTVFLLLTNYDQVLGQSASFQPYYFLTVSWLVVCLILARYKFSKQASLIIIIGITTLSIFYFLKPPTKAFGMSQNWNYPMERKAFELIESGARRPFVVANLAYETKGSVQKYLIAIHDIPGYSEDYENTPTLYLIAKPGDREKTQAYEVKAFDGAKVWKQWKLNDVYNLYQIRRSAQ